MLYVLDALAELLDPADDDEDEDEDGDEDEDEDELQAAVATAMSSMPHAPAAFRIRRFI